MGGGSSSPKEQTVTQTNLPEYARPYFERMMARTEGVSNQGYQAYGGKRVEGLNDYQRQAMQGISGMNTPAAFTNGVNQLGGAIQGAKGEANYQSGKIDAGYNAPQLQGPERVRSTFAPGQFDGATADQYMSPYQQRVTDIAKREAIRNHSIAGVGRDASAMRAGAFGGSRAALVNQEANRNLGNQLDDIQMKGSQAAYENAQQQFERDRQAQYNASGQRLTADQFNSTQGMNMNNQRLQAEQQRADFGLRGQIANEQARQAAAGIRQGAWNNVGQMSGAMIGAGKTQQDMELGRYGALMQVGDKAQQTNQAALDAAYDDFVNQRDYDKQMLQFYGGMLRGVPVTANSDVRTTQASNPLSQIAGLGIAGLGAYKAYQG